MVLLDLPLSAAVAGLLARRTDDPRPGMAFVGVGLTPTAIAFLERWTAWDTQYLVDPTLIPGGFGGLVALGLAGMGALGHWLGTRHAAWPAAFGLSLVLHLLMWDELVHVGSYGDYRAGNAPFLPAGYLWFCLPWFSWTGAVFAACWVWAGRLRRTA